MKPGQLILYTSEDGNSVVKEFFTTAADGNSVINRWLTTAAAGQNCRGGQSTTLAIGTRPILSTPCRESPLPERRDNRQGILDSSRRKAWTEKRRRELS